MHYFALPVDIKSATVPIGSILGNVAQQPMALYRWMTSFDEHAALSLGSSSNDLLTYCTSVVINLVSESVLGQWIYCNTIAQ